MTSRNPLNKLIADRRNNPKSRLFETFVKFTQGGVNNQFLSNQGRHVMAYTESENNAFEIVLNTMKDIGLKTHTDTFGNLFGIYYPSGCDKNAQAILTGSHIDSVGTINQTIGGGFYDGVLGVAAGIEAIQYIQENDVHLDLKRPIAVVCWRAEESSLWGKACIGSSLATGQLQEKDLQNITAKDIQNQTISLIQQIQQLRENGKAEGNLPACLDNISQATAIELHIEQGPNIPKNTIGIVTTAIAGSIRNVIHTITDNKYTSEVFFHQLVLLIQKMASKKDQYNNPDNKNKDLEVFRATLNRGTEAFNVGSAQEILNFSEAFSNQHVQTITDIKEMLNTYFNARFPKAYCKWEDNNFIMKSSTQFHTGTCPMDTRIKNNLDALFLSASIFTCFQKQFPYHQIPSLKGETKISHLDIRGTDIEYMKKGHSDIIREILKIRESLDVALSLKSKGMSEPASINKEISDTIENITKDYQVQYKTLISGAGHDVMKFKNNGLIFIHSHNGLSHDKEEYSHPEDMKIGTQVLTQTLIELLQK
jgi:hypothetical protein